jgi:hypothetical protein
MKRILIAVVIVLAPLAFAQERSGHGTYIGSANDTVNVAIPPPTVLEVRSGIDHGKSPYPNASIKIITTKGTELENLMEIYEADKLLLTVHKDGRVEYANKAVADKASEYFWYLLADNYRPVCAEAAKEAK